MTNEQLEHAIEFLLAHHARVSAEIEQLNEVQKQQAVNLDKQAANLDRQAANLDRQSASLDRQSARVDRQSANLEDQALRNERLTADVEALTEAVDEMRAEMRDTFNNLIIANEVTRDLAEKVGKLALATSQRVTSLEQK